MGITLAAQFPGENSPLAGGAGGFSAANSSVAEEREGRFTNRVAEIFHEIGCRLNPKSNTSPDAAPHLQQQRVAMVDDSVLVLAAYIPALVRVTNGNTTAVLFKGDTSTTDVAERFASLSPTVLLVDFVLSSTVSGTDIVPALRAKFPDALIFGFTSDPTEKLIAQFKAAGADGVVLKNGSPAHSLALLDAAVTEHLEGRRQPPSPE